MKFLQFTIASAVALVFSGAALTQSPGTTAAAQADPPQALGALDADRDGSISRAEAARNPVTAPAPLTGTPPPSTGTPPPSSSTPPPG